MTSQSSPMPTTSLPVFHSPVSQLGGFPQFLNVQQVVHVIEGSTAVLECTVANLGSQHTVRCVFLILDTAGDR